MANTVTTDRGGIVTIVPDGVTNFDMADYFPNGVYLRSINFDASDAADKLYVRLKSATGAQLIPAGLDDEEWYNELEPKRRFPFVKAADCTFTTPASCLITIYFD